MALVGKLSSFVSTLDGQIVHHTIDNYLPHLAMLELLSAVLLGPMEEQQPGTHGVLGRFPAVKPWPSISQFPTTIFQLVEKCWSVNLSKKVSNTGFQAT